MDALKKAELAKRQGNPSFDFEAPSPSEGLSLESIPGNSTPPLSLESPPQPVSNSAEPSRPKFPDLPSHLEDIEVRQTDNVRHEPTEAQHPKADFVPPAENIPVRQPEVPPASPPPAPPSPPLLSEMPRPTSTISDDARSKSDQQAAKNVFVAKSKTEPETGKKNRVFLIAVSVTTLCSAIAIGGYFWWQLQPKSGLGTLSTATAPKAAPLVPPVNAVAPPPAVAPSPAMPTAQGVAPPVTPSIPSVADGSKAGTATLVEKAIDQIKQVAENKDVENAKGKSTAQTERRQGGYASSQAIGDDRLFTVTKSPLRLSPALSRGYEAYERGDLAAARKEYLTVLKVDPHNLDALRGMAVISLRDGRPDAAESFFQNILVADPQDAFAISGLANLHSQSNPGAAENRLKNLAIVQPENSATHFALGNVFAAQEKWSEAQQSYFKAYSVEPGNPDILYNLAISLEHLRQNKLAVQYYQLAIQAATNRPSGFDPAQANARIRALQP